MLNKFQVVSIMPHLFGFGHVISQSLKMYSNLAGILLNSVPVLPSSASLPELGRVLRNPAILRMMKIIVQRTPPPIRGCPIQMGFATVVQVQMLPVNKAALVLLLVIDVNAIRKSVASVCRSSSLDCKKD